MNNQKFPLDSIKPPVDQRLINADEWTQAQLNEIEIDKAKSRARGLKDIIEQRKSLATTILYTTLIWLAVVTIIVILQGFNSCGFSLTSGTIQLLIGSTTVNIFSLLIIILKFIYNPKDYLL